MCFRYFRVYVLVGVLGNNLSALLVLSHWGKAVFVGESGAAVPLLTSAAAASGRPLTPAPASTGLTAVYCIRVVLSARPTGREESSDPTQHTKGRTGDRPGPRKETTTRRNVTQGGWVGGYEGKKKFVCPKWASYFWLYSKFHFSPEEIFLVWVGWWFGLGAGVRQIQPPPPPPARPSLPRG